MKPYFASDGIELYLGDARDVLPTLGGAHLLLTDPPYGVEATTTGNRVNPLAFDRIRNDKPGDREGVIDVVAAAWAHVDKQRDGYVFGPWDDRMAPGPRRTVEVIWDKGVMSGGDTDSPFGTSHERITFIRRNNAATGKSACVSMPRTRRGTVLRHTRPCGVSVVHPTQKPVSLLRELIEMSSRPGETVLDPFTGAGSTLVAAAMEGRRAIGIEIEEVWCETAVKRLRKLLDQQRLFGNLDEVG